MARVLNLQKTTNKKLKMLTILARLATISTKTVVDRSRTFMVDSDVS